MITTWESNLLVRTDSNKRCRSLRHGWGIAARLAVTVLDCTGLPAAAGSRFQSSPVFQSSSAIHLFSSPAHIPPFLDDSRVQDPDCQYISRIFPIFHVRGSTDSGVRVHASPAFRVTPYVTSIGLCQPSAPSEGDANCRLMWGWCWVKR